LGGYRVQAALPVGCSRQLLPRAKLTFGAAVGGNEISVGIGIGWQARRAVKSRPAPAPASA
jgi:hypothetical protein